ncbi:SCO family protein [Streptomyces sp. NPDC086519]|uniref:SCO family protein n=1 Tax=Streptomyces sp. NPDC086519 TaxID=3154863 RepID=UPI00344AF92C
MTAPGTGLDRPSFSLVDHDGTPVTEQTYRGHWTLVFFGFTHCKVVCPRALGKLSAVLDELGETAGELRPLYITVDPDRDTPQALRDFLRAFPRFTGLTGSADAVERVKGEFRVFARRRDDPDDPDGYSVPHTAITYLISPEGKYAHHFPDALTAAEITAGIRAFVVGGRGESFRKPR